MSKPTKTGLVRWHAEKWKAQDGSECGNYKGKGRVKCRPTKRITSKTPETWGEMTSEEKKKAITLKQKATKENKQFSSHKSGRIWGSLKHLKK